jgi:hypothetical protein
MGSLLVSLFNVEWGYYVWAGSVEVSEFCLLLVVFPAKSISSISPRFYIRKPAFCFLPLVAILESPPGILFLSQFFFLCNLHHGSKPAGAEAAWTLVLEDYNFLILEFLLVLTNNLWICFSKLFFKSIPILSFLSLNFGKRTYGTYQFKFSN